MTPLSEGPPPGSHESLAAQLLESVTDAVFALDRDWRFTYVNAAGERWTGLPRASLLGHVVWDVFPYVTGTDFARAYQRAMLDRVPAHVEEKHPHHDRWTRGRVYPTPEGIVAYVRDVSEERRSQQALIAQEARWRALIEEASDPIAVLDAEASVKYSSPAFTRLLGYAPGELAGLDSLTLTYPDDEPKVRATFALLLAEPEVPRQVEFRYRHKDGEWLVLSVTARNLLADPNVRGIVCNTRDVTAKRALTAQVARSERRLRAMFESTPLAAYVWQREEDDFVLVDFNEVAARISHGAIRDHLGARARDFFTSSPIVAEQIARAALDRDESIREEIDHVYRIGGERRRLALTYASPAPDLVLVFTEDLTEQREAESLFRGITEHSIVGVYVYQDDHFVYVNPQVSEIFGYTAEEILSRRGREWFVHPDDLPEMERRASRRLAGEVPHPSYSYRAIRKDGREIVVEVHGSSIRYRGRPALLGTILDITERRHSEQVALEGERRFRVFLENVRACALILDVHGRVAFANEELLRLSGWSAEEIAGVDWFENFIEDDGSLRATFDTAMQGGAIAAHHQNEVVTHDGRRRLLNWDNVVIRDAGGRITGLASIGQDVDERRELEAQLRQAQKMEAVGRLAGGIAHDFNNLLTVIQANAEFLLEDIGEDARGLQEVTSIAGAAERAATLTRQLLAFSRQQVQQPRTLDLNVTVVDMARMLRRLIGEDITLDLALEPGLAPVLADPGQLEQVVMNLVVNARDAMPGGGRLTITTRGVDVDNAAGAPPTVPPSSYVVLSVSDTGAGMERDVLARVFEPFFTTKPPGQGTGLGLSTVYGIVTQSGGHVLAYSEPGEGSAFTVYFPRLEEGSMQDVTQAAHPGRAGRETVLLTEDEDAVRAIARRILQGFGYDVLEAANGREALRVAAAHEGRIDLLLTDLVMPELGGRALAAELRKLRPDIRVLYMSGYTDDDIIRRGVLEPRSRFLEKPFSSQTLGHAIREVLDAPDEQPPASAAPPPAPAPPR